MEGSTPEVKGKTEILDSVFWREQKYRPVILLGKKNSPFLHFPGLNKKADVAWKGEKTPGFGRR